MHGQWPWGCRGLLRDSVFPGSGSQGGFPQILRLLAFRGLYPATRQRFRRQPRVPVVGPSHSSTAGSLEGPGLQLLRGNETEPARARLSPASEPREPAPAPRTVLKMAPRPLNLSGACGFCRLREQTPDTGLLFKTPDDQWAAHFNCMLFSPTLVTQATPDDNSFGGFLLEDVKKEILRGRRLKCCLCKHTGATIGCDIAKCMKSYHYLCAKKSNAEIIEDEASGIYKIYCHRHRRNIKSSGNENAEKLTEVISDDSDTTDNISNNDSDDDYTCDEEDENDRSSQSNKRPTVQPRTRKILKNTKTSTPQGKETNGSCQQLLESINDAIAGPSGVPVTPSESQKDSHEGTPRPRRKRRIHDSESSGSSVSILSQSMKKKQAKPVCNDTSQNITQCQRNLDPFFAEREVQSKQSMETQNTEVSHEESRNVIDTDENNAPKWIELLYEYHTRMKQPCHDDGQTNTINATEFWQLCREMNCMEVLFKKMKTSLESSLQHIQSQNAAEEDYEQAYKVLMATGCLKAVAEDTQQEIWNRKEALEREREHLLQKEKLLADLLPTLNKSTISESLENTAESATHGSSE